VEAPHLLNGPQGDPRRPFVLLGLGYLALCVCAVWIDHKIQMRRSRRRRERERKGREPE